MSENNSEKEIASPRSSKDSETVRKRMLKNNSGRKSWSLTDKRTDIEVLHEMGVGLLEVEDLESCADNDNQVKPNLKRKSDQENLNPNVNGDVSPRWKASSTSPKRLCVHSPGPSRTKSPRSSEKLSRALRSPQAAPPEAETPLQQLPAGEPFRAGAALRERSVSRNSVENNPFTPLTFEADEDSLISKALKWDGFREDGADSFSILSDEMMLSVFKWLPKRCLVECMLVCKRWHRVASDETFWQRLELGNRTLAKGALGRILMRKPIVVRLASSEIGEWSNPCGTSQPARVQYLDLSMCTIDLNTLNSLLERCPSLKKLSLENVAVNDQTCELIGCCSKLETLNMTMATGVTAEGLSFIMTGCTRLVSLNISWCGLSAPALEVLCSSAPKGLLRLNVAGARLLTNDMAAALTARCARLLELDASDCARLGAAAAAAAARLPRLEHLALSRCYLLPPHALTKLNSMPSLMYLEVWGMLQESSLAALRETLPAIQINQFMHSAIARPTVGTRRTSIWGFRTRD